MHMADALISPAVGASMWAASACWIAYCSRKVRKSLDDRLVPMMGVLGAFIFAAMMINFAIPLTGSSGHLGGGLLLAILLGPHAAFVVMASVLTVQAFFFADGGLLALGCNIFNLGFFPAFVAYPLVYQPLARSVQGGSRPWAGAVLAAVVGLQLGAFAVVLETTFSGMVDLPFRKFVLLMQPIHFAIGLVEGVATAAVVSFVLRSRPASVAQLATGEKGGLRRIVIGFLVAGAVAGGCLSWFASARPDGLEWALDKTSGKVEFAAPRDGLHRALAKIVQKTAFLADYGFREGAGAAQAPATRCGTSVSGLVGGLITLALAGLIGYGVKRRKI